MSLTPTCDAPLDNCLMSGVVVKLDRGFPMVNLSDGSSLRCEHATSLVKNARLRAAIGDRVQVSVPPSHDKGIIESIEKRRTSFVRKDPAERTASQVLAANFDLVIVVEPIVQLNQRRLERELVLAHETGADVAVVLSKVDLMSAVEAEKTLGEVQGLAGRIVPVLAVTKDDETSIEQVRRLVPQGKVAILIGKSGVGKSTLINALVGAKVQDTQSVREGDGKGRHTTVDRVMIELPDGGIIVDMPGIRGLGIWEAGHGLGAAFPDVEELAQQCKFRDCVHENEPGCAVRAAVESGELAAARFQSYKSLSDEIAAVGTRRTEARRMRGEKASDRRKRP